MAMFTVSYREEVRESIISKANSDARIVSAAVIGSYAKGNVDRWSDIDLTFGVDKSHTVESLLDSWTNYVLEEFSGTVLFDAQRGSTTYRVFILPECLQLDLSFTPDKEFGAMGPHFSLLFGKQYEKQLPGPQSTNEIFGLMIHHLLRARFCAERNRLWQATFWVNEARNYALKLACISRGLSREYGRGFDDLPIELLSLFDDSFVKKLSKDEIDRVIKKIILNLPFISDEVNEMTKGVRSVLNELSN